MEQLTIPELLSIVDTYGHHPLIERSLYLLSAVYATDVDTIAKMSIGERDARLLKFREWTFGSRLINTCRCPQCATLVEWENNIEDIRLQDVVPGAPLKILKAGTEGFNINFRLPNSYDIIRAISNPALAVDTAKFISWCILEIQQDQQEYAGEQLPQKIIETISEIMGKADPQADIKMVLGCPDCKNQWEAPFDILNYLWLELDSWAKRIIKEVAALARAFGWSERDILNLSPRRRQQYLEIVGG